MRKTLLLRYIFYLFIVFTASSCVSQKQIAYFQKGINERDTIDVAKGYTPRIQAGDILSINIGSLNPAASSFLNPYSTMPVNTDATDPASIANGTTAAASFNQSSAPGYLVNADGTIEIPLLGSIKLSGLTTNEARDTIRNRSKRVLKEPTVNVRVMNYKISVMGEVAKPSVYIIPNERITLPEALSLAGDLTIYGKRDNVMIIRDIDGKKEIGKINLNSREIFKSPYYYLHSNDLVYVEPNGGKVAQTDKVYQLLPVILSALSFLTIIIEYTHR